MANGPTLPPQAYTREILTSAFNWLQTQPESVKKLATTPDALVGLFMRAQRYGASSMELDAPVSSQNFISDLKNLAEGLKQFEKPKLQQGHQANQAPGSSLHAMSNAPNQAAHSPSATFHSAQTFQQAVMPSGGVAGGHYAGASASPHASHVAPSGYENHAAQPNSHSNTQMGTHSNNQMGSHSGNPMASPFSASASSAQLVLNERAQQMIHEVKNQLNLSSHAETINMLVALGYKQLGSLFKN